MNKFNDMLKKIGNERQIAGTRHCILTEGGALGVRAIDVKTGGGLEYTILPDRGLDISLASFKGLNLTYLSPQGELHPAFYNAYENEWLRTFFAGLLTTCGPTNIGPACEDDGQKLGQHGRFNVTPATRVSDQTDFEAGKIEITGCLNNYVLFGEKISVKRSIISPIGKNTIFIRDKITNYGGFPVPYAMLYHINFGFPLLDEHTISYVNSSSVEGYDERSQADISNVYSFRNPDMSNLELNYLHRFEGVENGYASVFNDKLEDGFGVSVKFNSDNLPFLTHWKMAGVRDYILALEPSNAPCLSRKELREKNQLPFLLPGETTINELEISIVI